MAMGKKHIRSEHILAYIARIIEQYEIEASFLVLPSYKRPSLIGYWNAHKGGTDVMSRIIKNGKFMFKTSSTKATIIWRFVQLAACNTLFLARLLSVDETSFTSYRKYRAESAHQLSYKKVLKSLYISLTSSKVPSPLFL